MMHQLFLEKQESSSFFLQTILNFKKEVSYISKFLSF